MIINQEFVKEYFKYDDGLLLLRKKYSRRCGVSLDTKVGSLSAAGYLRVSIDYRKYSIHRLIFLYHHGFLPEKIDHIDQNKTNNKIENLREASQSENLTNRGLNKTNTTGYKGVSFVHKTNKYIAHICKDNIKEHLGTFNTAKEAAEAYDKRAEEIHGKFVYNNATISDI